MLWSRPATSQSLPPRGRRDPRREHRGYVQTRPMTLVRRDAWDTRSANVRMREDTGHSQFRRLHATLSRAGYSGTMIETDMAGIVYRNAFVAAGVISARATTFGPPPAVIV
jgi:hypothetical protein